MSPTLTPASPTVAVPEAVHTAIDAIVQRAKIDKAGVYWQLGTAYRNTDGTSLATSLGYGTSGILLTLLEYHRQTADSDVAELLAKGFAWVQQRTRGGAFVHGFYGGTAGLWYLYRQADRDFPGHFPGQTGAWRAAALGSLRGASCDSTATLGLGAAGTIVGALASLELSGEELAAVVRPLVDRALAFAAVGETGLFWDCNVTSVRPPLGFLFGNAGIEYALAHVGAALPQRFTAVLLGSLARAQAVFDAQRSNWPDYDAVPGLRDADQAAIERILDRVEKGGFAPESTEYSVAWGSGAAGVLLGRSALAAAFPASPVGRLATDDVARAAKAIAAVPSAELDAMDTSIQNGLAGVALACRAAALRAPSLRAPLMRSAEQCEEKLVSRNPVVRNDDLSLLTGLAGQAYGLLMRETAADSCVDPLGVSVLCPVPTSASEADPRAALTLRMPACARLASAEALRDRPITLAAIRDQVLVTSSDVSSDVSRRCCERELALQQALSETNFRRRFWAELAAQRRFARQFGEGMDDNVLFGRFAVDSSVTVFDLNFDPVTGASSPPQHVLRQPGSKGVIEVRLSPLQAALLREFGQGAVALKVIPAVIDRVQTPNVTQWQLATLALKMIRGFIQGGQVAPQPAGALDAWLIRRKFREVRKNLFPAAAV